MNRTITEEDLNKLYEELSQPTKGISPLEVNSETEAKTTMEFIKTSLESKNDWAQRQETLNLAIQYFIGGIHFYAAGNPVPLVPTIKKLLSDLRAASVKDTLSFVIAVAQTMKAEADDFVIKLLQPIMKLLSHQNQVLANAAHISLLQTFKSVASVKYAKQVLTFASSTDAPSRQTVLELCIIAFNSWSQKLYPELINPFKDTLSKLLTDPSAYIAETADSTLSCIVNDENHTAPRKVNRGYVIPLRMIEAKPKRNQLSPIMKKQNAKKEKQKSRNPSPKPEGKHAEVSDELPPVAPEKSRIPIRKSSIIMHSDEKEIENENQQEGNEEEAELEVEKEKEHGEENKVRFKSLLSADSTEQINQYIQYINNANANNKWEEVDEYRNLIGPSFSTIIQKRKKVQVWAPILTIILNRYKEELQKNIFTIASTLDYHPTIIQILIEQYTLEELINILANLKGCAKNPNALPFLTAVINLDPELQTNKVNLGYQLHKISDSDFDERKYPTIRDYIEDVIAHNKLNKSCDLLNKYVQSCTTDVEFEPLLHAAINKANDGIKPVSEMQQLPIFYNPTQHKQLLENQLDIALSDLFFSEDEHKIRAALYMAGCYRSFPTISLMTLVEPIVQIMVEKCPWRDEAMQTLLILFYDVPSLGIAFDLATRNEAYKRIILEAIYLFFEKLPPQKIVPLIKAVIVKMQPFTSDNDEEIRKYVINTFVVIYKKIPNVFKKQMKKLPPATQRIVLITATKKKY